MGIYLSIMKLQQNRLTIFEQHNLIGHWATLLACHWLSKKNCLIFRYIQSCSFEIEPGPRYEVNLRVFAIAYHSLKMQLRSWSLLSKKIKTGGFQKCKVHCCNFKDFKVTSLQSLATPGFEPTPPAWVKRESFVSPLCNHSFIFQDTEKVLIHWQ